MPPEIAFFSTSKYRAGSHHFFLSCGLTNRNFTPNRADYLQSSFTSISQPNWSMNVKRNGHSHSPHIFRFSEALTTAHCLLPQLLEHDFQFESNKIESKHYVWIDFFPPLPLYRQFNVFASDIHLASPACIYQCGEFTNEQRKRRYCENIMGTRF